MKLRANSGLVLALTGVLCMASLTAKSQQVSDTPALAGAPSFRLGVISVADDTFLKKAWQWNEAEIKLGQLAETRGSGDSVKEFGRTLVKDHTAMKKKLEGLAKSKRVNWSSDMYWKHEDAYNRLTN